jgi:hypothetical protein
MEIAVSWPTFHYIDFAPQSGKTWENIEVTAHTQWSNTCVNSQWVAIRALVCKHLHNVRRLHSHARFITIHVFIFVKPLSSILIFFLFSNCNIFEVSVYLSVHCQLSQQQGCTCTCLSRLQLRCFSIWVGEQWQPDVSICNPFKDCLRREMSLLADWKLWHFLVISRKHQHQTWGRVSAASKKISEMVAEHSEA